MILLLPDKGVIMGLFFGGKSPRSRYGKSRDKKSRARGCAAESVWRYSGEELMEALYRRFPNRTVTRVTQPGKFVVTVVTIP
jgi:hypothetical protein